MRVYLANGVHYEKQADVPKGAKPAPVDFPFAASPKADFVAWLNERPTFAQGAEFAHEERDDAEQFAAEIAGDYPHGVGQPLPEQPSPSHSAQVIAFEDQFEAMPLATQLHYAALAVENARRVDFSDTTPRKAPQRYGAGQ